MKRGVYPLIMLYVLIFVISGCATTAGKGNAETQGLKNQIEALQAELRNKDSEIESLRDALSSGKEGTDYHVSKKARPAFEKKGKPSIKQIQLALKNAGYNPGRVDGTMGRQTRIAIKSFQKDNNIRADGRVGKQTWNLLKKYLEEKAK